ncbi:ATP-binding cassette domain-containing protein [Streptomyces sp. NPDC058457]|uniref:ATP-binding cassette domain-containing protein n=1 Tax=Streptomyces sp. NPDC058457 TaxID=3346507 RepID=UPI00365007A0
MTAAVRVQDLVKRYPGRAHNVVDHVSFALEPGSVSGLLGPNGAGKTTLAKLVCGVTVPTRGTVRVFGADPRAGGGAGKHGTGWRNCSPPSRSTPRRHNSCSRSPAS